MREIDDAIPEHLRQWWASDQPWCLHSAAWWRRHWQWTGIMAVELADTMPDGWRRWLDWHRVIAPDNEVEIKALEADRGDWLGYVRVVGRRRGEAKLLEPVALIPANYEQQPLLRSEAL